MKKTIILAVTLLMAGATTFAQTSKDTTHKHHHHDAATKKYTCTMHPEVVSNKPGNCPKCGMALVPMKKKTTKPAKPMDDKMKM